MTGRRSSLYGEFSLLLSLEDFTMIYLDIGRRENGKTTLAYYLVSQMPRTLVWDPRGQIHHASRESSAVARTPAELRNGIEYLITGELTELVFTPDESPRAMFGVFCKVLREFVKRCPVKAGILIDEIRFANLDDDALDWVLRCSPMQQFRIVFTGHRPADVPTDIRAIANKWLLFRFTLPHDEEVIERHTSPEVARAVKSLGPHQYIAWDDSREGYERFTDPAAWFIPLNDGGARPQLPAEEPIGTYVPEKKPVDTGQLFDKD